MYKKINLVYFSATGTTDSLVSAIGEGCGITESKAYPILQCPEQIYNIPNDEMLVFGLPVFSGRVPARAIEALNMFLGNQTPAIVVCVYGNRDFDDALLELKNTVEENGFVVISAAAFIAQHSIFPKIGEGRPDLVDLRAAKEFGRNSMKLLLEDNKGFSSSELEIKGNFPYKDVKKIPLHPKTDKRCNGCGICAKQCPVKAIDSAHPRKVDSALCISCAHCIAACPKEAKYFGGLLYKLLVRKFEKKYKKKQENYIVYRTIPSLGN